MVAGYRSVFLRIKPEIVVGLPANPNVLAIETLNLVSLTAFNMFDKNWHYRRL